MTQPGSLTRGQLPQRIQQYFRDNPDEELTYSDAVVKFDCNEKTLQCALVRCRSVGAVVTSYVIRRGPK